MNRPLIGIAVAVVVAVGGIVGAIGTGLIAMPTAARQPSATSTTAPTEGSGARSTPAASGAPSSSPTLVPSPSPTPTPAPEPTPVLVPAPLTGVMVSPERAARHPIAVMIDDLSAARPQSGYSAASVVWQAPAEGGIPRYMMIFAENEPKAVGPVRSSRYYYIAWAAEWKATYVHVGGSPQALATLAAQGRGQLVYNADEFRYGGRYLWRINERFAPHNVYSDGKTLRKLAGVVGARDGPIEAAWRFAPDAPLGLRPKGGRIDVAYAANAIRYDYDRLTNTYPRSVTKEGKQHDAATGERVAPKNVVIMLMSFAPLNDGHPNKKRLEANVIGKGTAWVATNGRTIKGTWRKDSVTGPTRFFGPDGKAVTLTAGQTFVQVLQTGSKVTIKDGRVPQPPARPRGAATAN